TLRVTVVDPSGAVIVGAHVRVTPGDIDVDTGPRGEAAFAALEPGRYSIHVEAPGFEPRDVVDARVRAGENRREVKLAIARLAEWHGATNAGFRSAALNARNAFAPVKGDERHHRYGFNVNGPLWKQHTSAALSIDGVDAFDTKTVVAALPTGFFADSIRKPNDALNLDARIEHALTKSQMLRAEAQRSRSTA